MTNIRVESVLLALLKSRSYSWVVESAALLHQSAQCANCHRVSSWLTNFCYQIEHNVSSGFQTPQSTFNLKIQRAYTGAMQLQLRIYQLEALSRLRLESVNRGIAAMAAREESKVTEVE